MIPPRDRYEPNDDAGDDAAHLWGRTRRIEATLDFWDDQNDVYAIRLRRGQPVFASLRGPAGTDTELDSLAARHEARRRSRLVGARRRASRPARPDVSGSRTGRPRRPRYYIQVKLGSRGSGTYKLAIVKA